MTVVGLGVGFGVGPPSGLGARLTSCGIGLATTAFSFSLRSGDRV